MLFTICVQLTIEDYHRIAVNGLTCSSCSLFNALGGFRAQAANGR